MTHNCNKCGVELNDDNWFSSFQKNHRYGCKECANETSKLYRINNKEKLKENKRLYQEANRDKVNAYQRLYVKNNTEKTKANSARSRLKHGHLPMSENRECSSFLGIHVSEQAAEHVLKRLFDDVVRMPFNNPGYDYICDGCQKIDVKGGCIVKNRTAWVFIINNNIVADYFLCFAFDNREDLNPLHIWLIPGHVLNHLTGTGISQSTLHKWAEYERPIYDAIMCCDEIRGE